MNTVLEPSEDGDLRRLHVLGRFGLLQGDTAERYDHLRGRDRRAEVREPVAEVMPLPNAGSAVIRQWGD